MTSPPSSPSSPRPTVSVIVHRSRILAQHHAYVRVDGVDAGYRDLNTGVVHCDSVQYFETVKVATAPLMPSTAPAPASATAALYRTVLQSAA